VETGSDAPFSTAKFPPPREILLGENARIFKMIAFHGARIFNVPQVASSPVISKDDSSTGVEIASAKVTVY
jgi:hypothetical protein